ncbi:MAG: thioredoxin family protein [Desulfovibrio sp.]|nr:thioredoxin family protein [Desulfovibrio sp.]
MTYSQMINEAPVVLVEFFATWCPHCQKMMPIVAQVKELLGAGTPVVQLDIDQNQATAGENGVSGVPTFIIYKNGQEVWRHSGEIDGNDLLARVQSYQ